MTAKLVIDRLGINIEDVSGLEPERFRAALVKALTAMKLPRELATGRLRQLDLSVIEVRPGEGEERLAMRTAESLARAIRESGE